MLSQILNNRDSPNLIPFALDILKAIIITTRPLQMKELAIAANLPKDLWDKEHQIRECALLCGSLLNSDDVLDYVSLVHPSVRDYLIPTFCPKPQYCRMSFTRMFCSEPEGCYCSDKCLTPELYPEAAGHQILSVLDPDYHFPLKDIRLHGMIAERCVNYLATEVFNQRRRTRPGREASVSTQNHYWKPPWAKYALRFWVAHARKAAHYTKDVMKAMKSLDQFLIQWLNVMWELRRCEGIPFDNQPPCLDNPPLLCIAAYTGIPEIVEAIVGKGEDVDQKDGSDFPALYYAANGGHEAVTRLLLGKGADVNAQSEDKITALFAAVKSGHEEVAEILLAAEADHSIKQGSLGETALHVAVDRMAVGMATILMEHGADVSSMDFSERTPLHIAAAGGTRMMESLLRIEKPRAGGCMVSSATTAFSSDSKQAQDVAKEQKMNRSYAKVVELLLDHGAEISAGDRNGHTPLHFAVDGGYESIAEELIDGGAEIDAMDKDGWTPLHWTTEKNLLGISRLLLKNHADPNRLDKFGRTVLHWASTKGQKALVELLLENTTQTNVLDTYSGATALHMAVYGNNKDIALLLLQNGANPNTQPEVGFSKAEERKAEWTRVPFPKEVSLGSHQLLLGKGMEEEHIDSPAGTPLYWASEEMATILLDHGADPNLQNSGFGVPPLHYAVLQKKEGLVKLLLERNASPNIRDGLGKAALHYTDKVVIAEMLLDAGAEIDAMDMAGVTALHTAAAYGDRDVLQLLLARGADSTLVDSSGQDALRRAEWMEAMQLKRHSEREIAERRMASQNFRMRDWVGSEEEDNGIIFFEQKHIFTSYRRVRVELEEWLYNSAWERNQSLINC
ncbi:ankyrin repeat [Fusarium equiseti]|uniref:Ankyrin repeat n=1 Tax=Fusarium equiseti TaxID=61235 RepID=A0ABQ8R4R8_FUSEQ|nr:ankyrin repeat [Fusarium equiseti]